MSLDSTKRGHGELCAKKGKGCRPPEEQSRCHDGPGGAHLHLQKEGDGMVLWYNMLDVATLNTPLHCTLIT